jgi:hypothetical protein
MGDIKKKRDAKEKAFIAIEANSLRVLFGKQFHLNQLVM